jgi:hypothetical protein
MLLEGLVGGPGIEISLISWSQTVVQGEILSPITNIYILSIVNRGFFVLLET